MDLTEPPEGCEISVDGAEARISSRWPWWIKGLLAALGLGLVGFSLVPLELYVHTWMQPVVFGSGAMLIVLVGLMTGLRPKLQAIRVSERDLVLDWSSRMGLQRRREHFELEDVLSLKVRHGSELLLRTTEETRLLPIGRGDVATWLASAMEEARDARSRREDSDRREYLFEQVVPEEVERLLD